MYFMALTFNKTKQLFKAITTKFLGTKRNMILIGKKRNR